jgi:diaminohydroxyphosphoribosylaminopyrimidine deaminase/5-amino-6-(5-phosphoribosylamino)uracil reductase
MRRALELAERGWGQTAPNPMVGAVVVRDGEMVGEGWHGRFGEPHAEVNAIAAAGERARGAHMYVTLEPCAHHGKTPPCTDAIVAAGITAVTVAAADPTVPAAGGAEALRRAGVAVVIGVEEESARELNAPFYQATVSDRPWVTLKLAVGLDGAIAGPARGDGLREPRWLTGEEARTEVHRMRAGADAIAVGVGTVIADDPRLTVRHHAPPRIPPVRVVFDRWGRTPLGAELVQSARETPTMIIAAGRGTERLRRLEEHGVTIVTASDPRTRCDRSGHAASAPCWLRAAPASRVRCSMRVVSTASSSFRRLSTLVKVLLMRSPACAIASRCCAR